VAPLDLYNSIVDNNSPLTEYARHLGTLHRYDIIHIHDWLTGKAGITLKHEWAVPLIVTIHATERGRQQGHLTTTLSYQIDRMEWQTCFEAWRVIVCSNYMTEELQNYFELPLDKINVIPNGINHRHLKTSSPGEIAQAKHLYGRDSERLLFFVGRISYEKGVQVLLKAMPQILNQYPKTRLLVAGKNSGTMLPLAQKLRIEEAVTFLGFISDSERDQIYQIVDAAVFPSLYEPFGIVALEAMVLGCNVITSNVGGLGEVVRHERNGLTVFPNDPDSITWAVDRLFSQPDAARLRRTWARQEVITHYNWPTIARLTGDLYQTVIEERRVTAWYPQMERLAMN
jgi:glycosyltransferase involved in cell wall biosynthesis